MTSGQIVGKMGTQKQLNVPLEFYGRFCEVHEACFRDATGAVGGDAAARGATSVCAATDHSRGQRSRQEPTAADRAQQRRLHCCTMRCQRENQIPPKALNQIRLDVPRTFALCSLQKFVKSGNGKKKRKKNQRYLEQRLEMILSALACRQRSNSRGGFTQGQNFIAALLLTGLFGDEQLTFCALCFICEKCVPPGYWSSGRKMLGMRSGVAFCPKIRLQVEKFH